MADPLQSLRNRIVVPNLDDRKWQDIVNEAVALIPQYAPQWTDQNPSDLGIALVELFAFLVEGLTYRLNRVPDKNYIAFLNLLGTTLNPAVPAQVYLTFTAQPSAVIVPQGKQAQTQGTETLAPTVFETDEAVTVLPINLTTAVEMPKIGAYSNVSSSLTIPPAGGLTITVPIGEAYLLCLGFDQSTAARIDLNVQLFDPIKLDPSVVPPAPQATINWMYSTGTRVPVLWYTIPTVVDNTTGLQSDGVVSLTIPADWASQLPSTVWQTTNLPQTSADQVNVPLFWVGMQVHNMTAGATSAPITLGIDFILFNSVSAHNALTIPTAESLGTSDGTAWQVFTLQNQPLYQKPDTDTPYDDLVVQVGGTTWSQVDDFPAGPGTFYKVNPVAGEISFGNYDSVQLTGNGSIPPSVQSITALTYRYVVGGTSGNVGPGAVTSLRSFLSGITGVTNLAASTDAADQQPIDEAIRQAPDSIKTRDRAVTADDYEFLAVQASTDVAIVCCLEPQVQPANPPTGLQGDPWTYAGIIRAPGSVNVIVVPDNGLAVPRPTPSNGLLLAVLAYLDPRRDLTVRLAVIGPAYLPIIVKADVKVWQTAIDAGLVSGTPEVASNTLTLVLQFLHPTRGGPSGTGWQVGQFVYISDLFRAIAPSQNIGYLASLTVQADTPAYHESATPFSWQTERPFDLGPAGASVRVADYELVCASLTQTITAEQE